MNMSYLNLILIHALILGSMYFSSLFVCLIIFFFLESQSLCKGHLRIRLIAFIPENERTPFLVQGLQYIGLRTVIARITLIAIQTSSFCSDIQCLQWELVCHTVSTLPSALGLPFAVCLREDFFICFCCSFPSPSSTLQLLNIQNLLTQCCRVVMGGKETFSFFY